MLRATTNNNREFYLKWEIPIIYNKNSSFKYNY